MNAPKVPCFQELCSFETMRLDALRNHLLKEHNLTIHIDQMTFDDLRNKLAVADRKITLSYDEPVPLLEAQIIREQAKLTLARLCELREVHIVVRLGYIQGLRKALSIVNPKPHEQGLTGRPETAHPTKAFSAPSENLESLLDQ